MILNSPTISGSLTVTGNILTSGSITLSGSVASASFAATASFVALAQSASYVLTAQTASFVANAQTASFVALAQSASNAVSAQTASFANAFTVASTLTAQTLVVQTITSSVDFVTGSTRFGSLSSNTHVFTGSVITSGSVGIGTTPAHSLTLVGGQTTPGSFSAGNYTFGIYSGSASTVLRETFAIGSDASYVYMQSFSSRPLYINRDGNNIILGSTAAGVNVGVGTTSPNDFIDAGLGLAIISTSGRTGLSLGSTQGTANEVLGRLSFTNTNSTNIGSKRLAFVSGLRGTTDNSAYLEFGTADNALGTQRMIISQEGNVFINNSSGVSLNSLTNKLSISSTTYNLFDISRFSDNAFGPNFYLVKSRNASIGGNTIVTNGDNLGNITWVGANGTGFTDAAAIKAEVDGTPGASNDMPGRLVFSTTADGAGSVTERMRITSGGVLRLLSQATYSSLTYEQTIQYATSPAGIFFGNSFNANNNVGLQFRTSNDGTGVQTMTLSSQGTTTLAGPTITTGTQGTYTLLVGEAGSANLSLGHKASTGGYIQTWSSTNLYFNQQGNAVYAGAVRLDTLSDERIKDNIQPISGSLDKVLQLNGKKFHLKDEPEDKIRYGFIAQDLEGILDEFVIQTDMTFTKGDLVVENVKSIENWASSWAALLVEAIKELKATNDALQSRIETLESK